MLNNTWDLGSEKKNCPTNEQLKEQGIPMFEQVTAYNTKDQEENKSKVEKQNFTISTGIAGGKDAEKEVWLNPFQ